MTLAEAQDAKRAADARWAAALEQLATATETYRAAGRKAGWLVGPQLLLAAAREVIEADVGVDRATADLMLVVSREGNGPQPY